MSPWSSCLSFLKPFYIPARQAWAKSEPSLPRPVPYTVSRAGSWLTLRKGQARSRQEIDGAVGSPAIVARIFFVRFGFVLFCFFNSFSYIFISRQSWMYDLQHNAHGSVGMRQMHSPAVYRMWRCLMLQCLLGLVLLYLGGWGLRWLRLPQGEDAVHALLFLWFVSKSVCCGGQTASSHWQCC